MNQIFHIVVCGSVIPDPLQTLEPQFNQTVPTLKNEMILPVVLDPWAAHALYEAANLVKNHPGSRIWLVSIGPKAKLQQLMMSVAQKVAFTLIAIDGPAGGFVDCHATADALAKAIEEINDLDRSLLLLMGGWESASRGSGTTLQMTGELLGITEQFSGVDECEVNPNGTLEILERIEGGCHLVSRCQNPPVVLGWATGKLPIPNNNPQIGMVNMRTIMPALQRAKTVAISDPELVYTKVELPLQQRKTRIVKDVPLEGMAREIVDWINENV